MLSTIAALVMLSWPVAEVVIALSKRAKSKKDKTFQGGGAAVVWLVVLPSVLAASATYPLGLLPLPDLGPWFILFAAALVFAGAVVRLTAILTLGKLFTVDVALREGHQLIQRGLYRFVRHPSYSGLLLSFLGVGLATGSWLGLALATIPTTAVLIHRIRIEEAVLEKQFGDGYHRYRERTRRLVPGLY